MRTQSGQNQQHLSHFMSNENVYVQYMPCAVKSIALILDKTKLDWIIICKWCLCTSCKILEPSGHPT